VVDNAAISSCLSSEGNRLARQELQEQKLSCISENTVMSCTLLFIGYSSFHNLRSKMHNRVMPHSLCSPREIFTVWNASAYSTRAPVATISLGPYASFRLARPLGSLPSACRRARLAGSRGALPCALSLMLFAYNIRLARPRLRDRFRKISQKKLYNL
jgi:hypothetical protein